MGLTHSYIKTEIQSTCKYCGHIINTSLIPSGHFGEMISISENHVCNTNNEIEMITIT